jgi:hypothetical protein
MRDSIGVKRRRRTAVAYCVVRKEERESQVWKRRGLRWRSRRRREGYEGERGEVKRESEKKRSRG